MESQSGVVKLRYVAPMIGNESDKYLAKVAKGQKETKRRRQKKEQHLIATQFTDMWQYVIKIYNSRLIRRRRRRRPLGIIAFSRSFVAVHFIHPISSTARDVMP